MRPLPPLRVSRRLFTAGLAGVGLSGLVPLTATRASAQTEGPWAARAVQTYQALREQLFLPAAGLYREGLPTGAEENPYSFLWPLREATAAAQHLTRVPGVDEGIEAEVEDHLEALERYLDEPGRGYVSYPVPPLGAGGDSFYDDNAIVGLEQVRRFRLAGEERMLTRAAAAFDFVTGAWDTGSTGPSAGGMHWVDADWNTYQGGTNVTSLAAELAAHLHEQTGQQRYLEWATRCYDWVRRSMRRDSGCYANGLLLDGTVEEALWTYNSGAMVGAATLLHRTTGEPRWLRRAQVDAEASLAYWTAEDRLYQQPVVFNAIYLANLLLFCSVRPSWAPEVLAPFADYTERLWQENRDPGTGLLTFQASGGGAPDPDLTPQTLHQSAVVQLCALLAWDPDAYADAA